MIENTTVLKRQARRIAYRTELSQTEAFVSLAHHEGYEIDTIGKEIGLCDRTVERHLMNAGEKEVDPGDIKDVTLGFSDQ